MHWLYVVIEGARSVLTWNNVLNAVSIGLVIGVAVTSYLYYTSPENEENNEDE